MIVAAAIELNGTVWSLPRPARHHHVISLMVEKGAETPIKGTQGFLTHEGTFLTRRQAELHARECGQLMERLTGSILTSEDLW